MMPLTSGNKIAHLEMIQRVVDQANRNSFIVKMWSVISVVVLLLAGGTESFLAMVVLLSSLWFLDAYCLRQQRLFSALYDDVRVRADDQIDFSMTPVTDKSSTSLRTVLWSGSLMGFYLPLIGGITVIFLLTLTIL